MPLYAYRCLDCGAELEFLHAIGKNRETCGLSCRRRDEGPFGKGRIERTITAPALQIGDRPLAATSSDRRERLDGAKSGLSEAQLDRARDKGLTIYRKDSTGGYSKDGGDASLPSRLGGKE